MKTTVDGSGAINREPSLSRDWSVTELAAVVALGVSAWLYGAHVILLGEVEPLAEHLSHTIRDAVLAYPLAILAVAIGRGLASRWGIAGDSARGRLGLAAVIALVFALGLVPGVGVHQALDRVLDQDAPGRLYHGHGLRAGIESGTDPVSLVLHGCRDAMIGLAAAFPVTLLGLGFLARPRAPRGGGEVAAGRWTPAGRWAVCTAGVLVVLGVGTTGLTFWLGEEPDGDHATAVHSVRVTAVPTGSAAEVDGLRVITRSAKWVRHTAEAARDRAAAPSDPDRLYLVFTVENLDSLARTFGRNEVRLQAPSGAAWTPLADNFPAIRLGPRDSMTSMLIFEVPTPEQGLQLAWARNAREARIPISDGIERPKDETLLKAAR